MKTKLLLFIALMFSFLSFSQGVNLKRKKINVSYVRLPNKPILDSSKRTFSSNINMSIGGFTKVNTNGNLDVEYRFNGTEIGEVEIKQTKHQKKDDDGKVISTTYTYNVHVLYTSRSSVSIVNTVNPENSFDNNYKEEETFKSKDFRSRSIANDYYNNNRYEKRNEYRTKHRNKMLNNVKRSLKNAYGYEIQNTNDIVLVVGKKKHPEYTKHQEYYLKAKDAYAKIKYNEPVANLEAEFKPLIAYYESLIGNYQGTKKKQKKMRYASYYNIANMYYYLEQPEKAREYGQKIIDNDYSKSDGRGLINSVDKYIKSLEVNKLKTRHFEVITKNEANSLPDKEEKVEEELKVVKGYLITSKNDTLNVDIKESNISKIGKSIKTVGYNRDTGEVVGELTNLASNVKEILLLDGTHYKTIKFKHFSGKENGGITTIGATQKICKLVYESKKITLYSYNDEEPVLFITGDKKPKSTKSTTFVFGFKKNLLKIAEGCSDLSAKVESKEFKNNVESLTKFCKELSACE